MVEISLVIELLIRQQTRYPKVTGKLKLSEMGFITINKTSFKFQLNLFPHNIVQLTCV